MGVTSMGVSGSWSLKWTGPIIQLISTWFSIIFASTSSYFVTVDIGQNKNVLDFLQLKVIPKKNFEIYFHL